MEKDGACGARRTALRPGQACKAGISFVPCIALPPRPDVIRHSPNYASYPNARQYGAKIGNTGVKYFSYAFHRATDRLYTGWLAS
jgi:hypothetical protein